MVYDCSQLLLLVLFVQLCLFEEMGNYDYVFAVLLKFVCEVLVSV